MDPIRNADASVQSMPTRDAYGQSNENGFKEIFKSLVSQVNDQMKDANKMAEEFAVGKRNNIHEIMIAAEKADISFRFLLQIRNKLLEAYQEIMRMNF
jgi:flagellar hook-basal body complex protein FliE